MYFVDKTFHKMNKSNTYYILPICPFYIGILSW